VVGGEREGKPAAQAEADHADLAGAIRPSRQPGANSVDIVVGPPLPRAQIADDRAHAGNPSAPRKQIGRRGQKALARQPVGLVSQVGVDSAGVVGAKAGCERRSGRADDPGAPFRRGYSVRLWNATERAALLPKDASVQLIARPMLVSPCTSAARYLRTGQSLRIANDSAAPGKRVHCADR
jgi:hypothetical protein